MSDPTDISPDSASYTPQDFNLIRRLALLIASALVGIFGLLQTQMFVSLVRIPSRQEIESHKACCAGLQQGVRSRYCQDGVKKPEVGIRISTLFNDTQHAALNRITKGLMSDPEAVNYFKNTLGVSLENVSAVIIPGWHTLNDANDGPFGLTEAGGDAARTSAGDVNVEGFTLRDRCDFRKEITLTGTPRVAINLRAFDSEAVLKLTIMHELLHALNVPGYRVFRFTVLQTDLTYLPEYRDYVASHSMEGSRQMKLWLNWVCAPWAFFLLLIVFTPWQRSEQFLQLVAWGRRALRAPRNLLGVRKSSSPLADKRIPLPPDDPHISQ